MGSETTEKSKGVLKLVTLERGLKLAESWVNKMSGPGAEESTEVEFIGRQARVGLGAKVEPRPNIGASAGPIERRILGKLNAQKRRNAQSTEELNPSKRVSKPSEDDDDDDSDEDPESRAKAFTKKRPVSNSPSLPANKKAR